MRQDFLNIVQKLKTDSFAAISVYNLDADEKIIPATYGNEFVEKYGSVENFFEDLKAKGIVNILVQEHRKNGSGSKNKGNPMSFNFAQKKETIAPVVHEATPMPAQQPFFGLAGTGLGFTEIMQLNTDSVLKARLEVENEHLKTRNKELEAQVYELKEEKLSNKYDAEAKSGQADLIKTLIQNAPALLGAFTKQTPAGLNAVHQPTQNVSEVKQHFINMVQSPAISDDFTEFLFGLINRINTDAEFYESLENLLNPKQQGNEPTE